MIEKIEALIKEMEYWNKKNGNDYAWKDGVYVTNQHFAAANKLLREKFILEKRTNQKQIYVVSCLTMTRQEILNSVIKILENEYEYATGATKGIVIRGTLSKEYAQVIDEFVRIGILKPGLAEGVFDLVEQ